PAVNVVIVAMLMVLAIATWLYAGLQEMDPRPLFDSPVGMFLLLLGMSNMILILFNMLPAFPMDGGRVFRALLSLPLGQLWATRIAAGVGLVISLLLIAAGLVLPWGMYMLPVVGMFVLIAGRMELRYVEWKHRLRDAEEEI